MRMLLVGQAQGSSDIVYCVSLDGKTATEIVGTSKGPISPADLVRLCKEHDCKITAAHYYTYVNLFIHTITAQQHIAWTRESMNSIVAQMQDDEYDSMLDEFFDSDNYPLMEDLMEVFADTDTYEIIPKS